MKVLLTALAMGSLGAACQAPDVSPLPAPREASASVPRQPVTVEANWKERLDQPYVYLEHRGDYRELGDTMRRLLGTAQAEGISVTGPPFALYFDDPGRVPVSDLRARACLPVGGPGEAGGVLAYEVLPQAMVAYGLVAGSYDRVPRAYPVLFSYLGDHGWLQCGPLREIYLVNPAEVSSFEELITEVQVPWTSAR